MNCEECRRLLDAHLDNELDVRTSTAVQEHLVSCQACSAHHASLGALAEAVRGGATYHSPPPGLQLKLAQSLRRSLPAAAPSRAPRRRAWLLGGPALLAAAALALLVLLRRDAPFDDRLADEVVAVHIRSLLVDHITDVASSDQHTVKPWFQGKVAFAVSARDLADRGFPLLGGRLDYVDGEQAAALVYKSAQHFVNVLCWPAAHKPDTAERAVERRGYHGYGWVRGGLRYFVVSDLNAAKLHELVVLLQTPG